VFGAWFVRKLARRESWQPVVGNPLFPPAILFMALVLVSMLWARNPAVTRSGFLSIAQMTALALLILDLVNSRKRLDVLIKVLVAAATLAAFLTVYQYTTGTVRRAGDSISGGINETAIVLVTLIPLGFYLLRTGWRTRWRLLGLLFVPLAALAVSMTFSRFNLLLIPPVLLVLIALSLRERASRPWVFALVVVGAVGAVAYAPWEKLQERAESIGPYLEQTLQFGGQEAETSSRGFHLRVGLAIARDHPLLGVGYGNYGYYFIEEYQFLVPGADGLYQSPRSPHSSYIGIAADLGAVGLALWLGLLGVGVVTIVRAMLAARRLPPGRCGPRPKVSPSPSACTCSPTVCTCRARK
jgi:O-antigen ligase